MPPSPVFTSTNSPYPHKRTSSLPPLRKQVLTGLLPTAHSQKSSARPALSEKRPFFRDETAAASGTPIRMLQAALYRPFFLLTRRGPLPPVIVLGLILVCLAFRSPSTSNDAASLSSLDSSHGTANAHSRMGRLMQQGLTGAKQYIPGAQWASGYWPGTSSFATSPDLPVEREDRLWEPIGDDHSQPEGGLTWLGLTSSNSEVLPANTSAIRKDGRMLVIEGQEHPIPKLMKRAKKRWENLKKRQSKTFAQAVKEYKRRYGRNPPKGFDKWYAFARANNVKLIDEFDLIERDLHAFRAISPESFRARVKHLQDNVEFCWGIRIRNGKSSREGELAHHARAVDVEALHKRFVQHVPDQLMWYSGHDNARVMIPWEEKMRLYNLVARNQYDESQQKDFKPELMGPEPHWGIPQVCPEGSAMRQSTFEFGQPSRDWTGLEMSPLPTSENENQTVIGTVIDSFKGYMDVCNSPQYRHYHSSTSWVFPHWSTGLLPLMTPGVHSHFNDIHALVVEQFGFETPNDPSWEERPFDRLVWRGQTSGPQWDQWSAWITSHRSRLHLLSHQEKGFRDFVVTVPESSKSTREVAKRISAPNFQLNPQFLDTGMVGPAVQCIGETCAEMDKVYNGYDPRLSFDRANLYKYVLDVDGNSWSGRFRRLQLSNACVFKATVYTEFWSDWAIPWLHFVPVQVDYSDLWDVMAFFRGGLNGEGNHDHLAREIAKEGKKWAQEHFRWADLEVYQFRLMLEYGRLWASDRDSMDFMAEDDELRAEPVWEEAAKFHKQVKRTKI